MTYGVTPSSYWSGICDPKIEFTEIKDAVDPEDAAKEYMKLNYAEMEYPEHPELWVKDGERIHVIELSVDNEPVFYATTKATL